MTPKDAVLKALLKPNSRWKFRDLVVVAQTTNKKLEQIIAELRSEGRQIVYGKVDHRFYLSRIPTPYSDYFNMTHLPLKGSLGLISDTHLCSKAERLDLIEYAYDTFVKRGVSTVLHAGD